MPKTIEQWLLFKYIGGEFTPHSKPFKTKDGLFFWRSLK